MNRKIKTLFDRQIIKMHNDPSVRGKYLYPAISKDADSYFETPQRPEYIYLNQIRFDRAGLEQHLSQLWKDEPGLLKIIPELVNLAFALKEENMQQSEELTPFLYAMF